MSLHRRIWNIGQAVTDIDIQKVFDIASELDAAILKETLSTRFDQTQWAGTDGVTSGNTLTTAAGGIYGQDFSGGVLTIIGGANAGEYIISGTPTANTVVIAGTFPSALSSQTFLLSLGKRKKGLLPLAVDSTTRVASRIVKAHPSTSGALQLDECVAIIFDPREAGGSDYLSQLAAPLKIRRCLRVTSPVSSEKVAANSSGATRYDLVYLKIELVTRTVDAHKKKRLNGTIGVDPINKTVSVGRASLGFVQNVNGTVYAGVPPLAFTSLPADTATEFYFPLGTVKVLNGYALGTAINSEEAGGTYFAQQWKREWFLPRASEMKAASIFTDGITQSPSTPVAQQRWGKFNQHIFVFRHKTSGNSFQLDGATQNWKNRMVWGKIMRPTVDTGLFKEPQNATKAGADISVDIPPFFTGNTGGDGPDITLTSATGFAGGVLTAIFRLSALGSGGKLQIRDATPVGPYDATNGDTFILVLYSTDPFVF